MDKLTDKLISIFATNNFSEIKNDTEFLELYKKYKNESLFKNVVATLTEIKEDLDLRYDGCNSAKEQVIEALYFMNEIVHERDDTLSDNTFNLILKMSENFWTDKQTQHFIGSYNAMLNKTDYFFSYTDRNPNSPNLNSINRRYKHLIIHLLGEDKYKNEDKNKKNLLAESLNSFFQGHGLKGFYYPREEGTSYPVDEKLTHSLKNSYVFIQLIQNIMFTKPEQKNGEKKKNYCHKEFKTATNHFSNDNQCMKFLLAERNHDSLVDPVEVPRSYQKWYHRIAKSSAFEIAFTEKEDPDKIIGVKDSIREKVVEDIKKSKWEFLLAVPSD